MRKIIEKNRRKRTGSREKRNETEDEGHDLDLDILNVSARKAKRQDHRRDLSCLLHVASLFTTEAKNRATSLFCRLFYPKINTDIGALYFLRGMRHVCHVMAVTREDIYAIISFH